jgi:hypothetical protein
VKSGDIYIEFPVVGIDTPPTISVSSNDVNRVIELVRYTLSRSQLDNSSFDWEFFERELKLIID